MAPAVREEFRQESSDQITCFERWRNHGKRNQETQNKNACLDQASEQWIGMTPSGENGREGRLN